MEHSGPGGSLDTDELRRFGDMAARWWDPQGPMAPLHKLNPVRLSWLSRQICNLFGRDANGPIPLAGLRLLDVGCGGGLLCEPLARLGAEMTGIDPSDELIELARWHAGQGGLDIAYRSTTIEDIAAGDDRFDVVLALEVVEHVVEPDAFIACCCAAVAPGGMLAMSTLSRTINSWLGAIVGAEWLMGWLPRGTHTWSRFVKPSQLARMVRASGFTVHDLTGVGYDAATGGFRLERSVAINYMMTALEPSAVEAGKAR